MKLIDAKTIISGVLGGLVVIALVTVIVRYVNTDASGESAEVDSYLAMIPTMSVAASESTTAKMTRPMVETLTVEITGRGGAIIIEDEMLTEIEKIANSFRLDSVPNAETSVEIRKAFDDVGFKYAAIGFVLAAARSKFEIDGAGLFRVSQSIITQYTPDGLNLSPTVIAGKHLKDLFNSLDSDDDILFAIACFGKTTSRIGEILRNSTAEDRRNIWKMYKLGLITDEEINRVISFLAAGIVAENPEAYGSNLPSLRTVYQ